MKNPQAPQGKKQSICIAIIRNFFRESKGAALRARDVPLFDLRVVYSIVREGIINLNNCIVAIDLDIVVNLLITKQRNAIFTNHNNELLYFN